MKEGSPSGGIWFLSFLVSGFLAGFTGSTTTAQFGKVLGGPFDIQKVTGNGALYGIEFGPGADPANPGKIAQDYLWVTGRRTDPKGSHFLYQIDVHASGGPRLAASHKVPTALDSSLQGLYDLSLIHI